MGGYFNIILPADKTGNKEFMLKTQSLMKTFAQ